MIFQGIVQNKVNEHLQVGLSSVSGVFVQIACNVAMLAEQHSVLTSIAFRSLHDLNVHNFVLGRRSWFTLNEKLLKNSAN